MSWRRARRRSVGGLFLLVSCAHGHPLPEALRPASPGELFARVKQAAVPVQGYVTDVRLAYSGKQGGARVLASLAVQRPGRLRYEVRSPFGSTLQVLACNGREVQLLDAQNQRFYYGPSRPDNLDRLFDLVPLHFGADAWVALFFGELAIPDAAELAYDEELGRFVVSWPLSEGHMRAEVDPATARLVSARVLVGERVEAAIDIVERDRQGLPKRLRIAAPGAAITIDATLVDLETDPSTLNDATFALDPPVGFLVERLRGSEP